MKSMPGGAIVLLHACCHNPTGADLTDAQWAEVIQVVTQRGLIPFLDMAYQGFGDGIEADGKVVDLFAQAGSRVNQFQTAVERYALSNYKVLQEAEEQCFALARECILLLDHLDIMIKRAEQQGEPVNSLRDARRRLCSLLETAQIEEIPVYAGDIFDGALHIPASVVGESGPDGVVVEVSRKGYAMKVSGKGDVLVRAAEVTVSTRRAAEEPVSGGSA